MNSHDPIELLNKIDQKDKRFRFAQSIFIISMIVTIIVLAIAQYKSLVAQREAINQIRQSQILNKKNNDDQYIIILRYLKCIALIKPDDRTPQNVQACVDGAKITADNAKKAKVSPVDNLGSESTKPAVSAHGPQNGVPSMQSSPVPPAAQPVTIIGIPVCIPLTKICISQ